MARRRRTRKLIYHVHTVAPTAIKETQAQAGMPSYLHTFLHLPPLFQVAIIAGIVAIIYLLVTNYTVMADVANILLLLKEFFVKGD